MTWDHFWQLYLIEMGYGVMAFVALFFISAPYGRHSRKGWGPTTDARNAWIVQEFPAFAVILAYFIQQAGFRDPVSMVFLVIWQIHYAHRTFVYPFSLRTPEKPYPWLLVIMAIVFNTLNGLLHGAELFKLRSYEVSWLTTPQFIVGLGLFILGYVLNKQSDQLLATLRRDGEGKYQIPNGGMFTYVSCPNYLGEMLEWLGWAVLTWSYAGLAFFLFTVFNLLPRALSNHRWYRSNFDNYPRTRKALIPFIL